MVVNVNHDNTSDGFAERIISVDLEEFNEITLLYDYLVHNRDGLIPYKLRKDINMPTAPQGIEYKNLGTMEHNICDVLAQRMKGSLLVVQIIYLKYYLKNLVIGCLILWIKSIEILFLMMLLIQLLQSCH